MLEGEKLPEWLADEFAAIKARIPPAHFTYVSTTPTAQNRINVAPQCGATEGEPGPLPAALKGAAFDNPQLVGAYLEYNRRVLEVFEPRYLVVGIEISELALQAPAKWPAFERLYTTVYQELDQSHPDLSVGPEMVLQTLMGPIGTTVRPLVEQSDFLGISFYPYASPIGEAMGAPALPDPPAQWQEPLDWLRDYTDTPIAIAETGYITRDVDLPTIGIRLQGDASRQRQFLTDLVAAARRDDYLFVVWFVPVDYTALVDKTGATGEALDLLRIWQYAGLLDAELQSKPAWPIWTAAAAK
ncbi:hypothetical protein D6201_12630 [Aurantiacibacter aquimixticola]|uniref:Arabinogalactan endo-beta-1,4-galactanase n=2 Tax=Aurantiacibacter aquimixticola TaxID=1958945 RepID=A0A419RNE2_9SPHN|nr:hypothetical protein D6201_12630 [Aurantiacibacter aquimixticola]